jgi:hypothetical protein
VAEVGARIDVINRCRQVVTAHLVQARR